MSTTRFVAVLVAVISGCLSACTDLDADEVSTTGEAIINGRESYPNQQPWMARLGAFYCGASLLHPSWAVTAAHCVDEADPGLPVVFGDHHRTIAEPTEQRRSVRRIIVHPDWVQDDYVAGNDIALLELSSPVEINEFVQTVALPTSLPRRVTAVGWGSLGAGGGTPSTLREASLGIVSNVQCGGAGSNVLCAIDRIQGSNDVRSVCYGDSGGPLLNEGRGRRELVGITSYTMTDCEAFNVTAGGFTSVAAYAPWIVEQIGTRLRGDVRMTFGGNLSSGSVQLACTSTGQYRRGPTNVRGTEIALDCPDADVVATCRLTSPDTEISELRRTVDGVDTTVAVGGTFQSDRFRVPAGSVVAWTCYITD